MTIPTIYFDEAGNTGQELFNADQPWYVLAAVNIEADRARELIDSVRVKNYAEIKFTSLKKSRDGREALRAFYEVLDPESVKAVAYNKRFMITTEIVDLLVETLAHATDFDLYQQGANIALSNVLHIALPTCCGQELFENSQRAFVEMIRRKTPGRVYEFYAAIDAMDKVCQDPDVRELIGMLSATRAIITDVIPYVDKASIDPAVPSFTLLCDKWGRALKGYFEAVHDNSLLMEQQKALLDLLMDSEEPEVEIGYDRRKSFFPLRARSLRFASSTTLDGLQVADLIAGGLAYLLRHRSAGSDSLVADIMKTNLAQIEFSPIEPTTKITPEQLGTSEIGGINPVNYTAAFVAKKKRK